MKRWLLILAACGAPPPVTIAQPTRIAPTAATTLPVCHGEWCFVNGGAALRDVTTTGNEAWAVGSWGTVMHHDGSRWTIETIGDVALNRVWARTADDVWVVGERGFIARRDATGWKRLVSGTTETLFDVDGLAGDDVWIGGGNGVVLHWNGGAVSERRMKSRYPIYAVAAIAKDLVWLSHGDEVVAWNDATRTTEKTGAQGTAIDLRAFAPDDVWSVDSDGNVARWDGRAWSGNPPIDSDHRNPGGRITGTRDDVWIAGQVEAHQREQRSTMPAWTMAATRIGNQFLAVGHGGAIERSGKREWGSAFGGRVEAIWSDDRTTLIVGDAGVQRVGETIESISKEAAFSIAGPSATDLWIGGRSVLHFDGKTARPIEGPMPLKVESISPPWIVGASTIARIDGDRWIEEVRPDVDVVTQVWAASPTLAWAIGYRDTIGRILRWDGKSWTIVQRLPDEHPRKLVGVDESHAWISTDKRLLAWDGKAWSTAKGWPENTSATAISVVAPDDVWVAMKTPPSQDELVTELGDGSVMGHGEDVPPHNSIAHWDGNAWTRESIAIEITAILAKRTSVWIGGPGGALLRRTR